MGLPPSCDEVRGMSAHPAWVAWAVIYEIAQLPRTEIYEIHQNTRRGSLDAMHDGKTSLAFPFFLPGTAPLVYHDTTPFLHIRSCFLFTFMAAKASGGLVLMDALPDLRMGRWEGEGEGESRVVSTEHSKYISSLWSFRERTRCARL